MAGISTRIVGCGLAAVAIVGAAVVVGYLLCSRADVSRGDPDQRIAAIRRIAAEGPLGAGDALARAAANDPSPDVRREAIAGLSHVLAAEHRSVVEKSTADPDTNVRAIAADTLGLFRDKAAADVLVRLIESDPEEQVVIAALRGLVRCDDPRATVVLLETADKGQSRTIKLVAMKGLLRKFGGKLPRDRDPDDEATWRDLIQRWKRAGRVREAYAAAGVRLVDRPQDILGKEWHPERRE